MKEPSIDQSGLRWEPKALFAPARVHPCWSKDPDIDAIKATLLQDVSEFHGHKIDIVFLAEGVLNKAYRVHDTTTDTSYIMRLSMPLHPYYKTTTEVTTLEYLNRYTTIPSPKVYAHSASSDNMIGYEWILLSMMPGVPLRSCWRELTIEDLQKIVTQFAAYQADLYTHQFSGIGGLRNATEGRYETGRMSTIPFWWYKRVYDQTSKGPFDSTKEWVAAELHLKLNEANQCHSAELAKATAKDHHQWTPAQLPNLERSKNGDEYETTDFKPLIDNAKRMIDKLGFIFEDLPDRAEGFENREVSTLAHTDVSANNLLIDPDTKRITGIVDWENVSAVPLQVACDLPEFLILNAEPGFELPKSGNTAENNPIDDTKDPIATHAEDDDHVKSLIEHQKTVLGFYFLKEMERICPSWIEQYHKGTHLRDFLFAVDLADDVASADLVSAWLDWVEAGQKRTITCMRHEWTGTRIDDEAVHSHLKISPSTNINNVERLERNESTNLSESKEVIAEGRPTTLEHIDAIMEHADRVQGMSSPEGHFQHLSDARLVEHMECDGPTQDQSKEEDVAHMYGKAAIYGPVVKASFLQAISTFIYGFFAAVYKLVFG